MEVLNSILPLCSSCLCGSHCFPLCSLWQKQSRNMLPRILEPEVMDSTEDAREYDAMDHSTVNTGFVNDLLAALTDWSLKRPVQTADASIAPIVRVLDLGAGTAQIPIELARRAP